MTSTRPRPSTSGAAGSTGMVPGIADTGLTEYERLTRAVHSPVYRWHKQWTTMGQQGKTRVFKWTRSEELASMDQDAAKDAQWLAKWGPILAAKKKAAEQQQPPQQMHSLPVPAAATATAKSRTPSPKRPRSASPGGRSSSRPGSRRTSPRIHRDPSPSSTRVVKESNDDDDDDGIVHVSPRAQAGRVEDFNELAADAEEELEQEKMEMHEQMERLADPDIGDNLIEKEALKHEVDSKRNSLQPSPMDVDE